MDNKFYFVDLPGYGYSKMPKEMQQKVGKFIEEYLFKGKNIVLIVHLLDIRHKPTKDDILMYKYLKNTNLPFILVANKADKIAITKVNNCVEDIRNELDVPTEIKSFAFSAERRIYADEIWKEIEEYIN